jgi:hypothetical protein
MAASVLILRVELHRPLKLTDGLDVTLFGRED